MNNEKIAIYQDGDKRIMMQGDHVIVQIDSPDVATTFSPLKDRLVIGHSETGHHHVIVPNKGSLVEIAKDENGYFIKVNKGEAEIIHEKADGHEPQTIGEGLYFFGNQWEYNELQDRKVID